MVTIKIESTEISQEEADNLIEAMLTHFGWACFVDRAYIGNKKVFDGEDKKDIEWIHNILNERSKRIEKLKELRKESKPQTQASATPQSPNRNFKAQSVSPKDCFSECNLRMGDKIGNNPIICHRSDCDIRKSNPS